MGKKSEDFNVLEIQTHALKVNIHCDGCKLKVKKLLNRIEGVYSVIVDVDQQKVTVSGNVNSETLIQRLIRAGKRAELWPHMINQNQKLAQPKKLQHQQMMQISNTKKDSNNINNNKEQEKQRGLMRGLKVFKNQHTNKFSSFSSDEEEEDEDEDDDFDDDDEAFEDLRFINRKVKQMNFRRQPAAAAPNVKKQPAGSGNGNANAKGPNGSQQKGINGGGVAGSGNANAGGEGEGKRIPTVHGGSGMMGSGLGIGGGSGGAAMATFGGGGGQQYQPSMMVNMAHHPSTAMVNNIRGHQHNMNMMMQQQQHPPQMMHLRSPQISPFTGYYYNSYPSAYNYLDNGYYGAHLFSDENANACSIM